MSADTHGQQFIPVLESIPYPKHPLLKAAFKLPIVLWRLGLGGLTGRLFMIMTTIGRKSGQPRRTAIEYHEFNGKTYVLAAWPKSDWYQNLLSDPRVTIQTAHGTQACVARRLTDDGELAQVFEFVEKNPFMRRFWEMLGFNLTREEFLAQKDRFYIITFEPTDQPTPPPLEADLKWLWAVIGISGLIGFLLGRRSR